MLSVAIIAAGEFPARSRTLSQLSDCSVTVCCDGAADALTAYGVTPDYVIGDMDSITPALAKILSENGRTVLEKSSDQETNDLTKAFRLALTLSPDEIHIFGATGRREDHTVANISLLADYADEASRRGAKVDMISDYGIFKVVSDSCIVQCEPLCEVSLFCYDPALRIHAEGLRYPTDRVVFDKLWKASLNVALKRSFALTFNHPAQVLVYLAD